MLIPSKRNVLERPGRGSSLVNRSIDNVRDPAGTLIDQKQIGSVADPNITVGSRINSKRQVIGEKVRWTEENQGQGLAVSPAAIPIPCRIGIVSAVIGRPITTIVVVAATGMIVRRTTAPSPAGRTSAATSRRPIATTAAAPARRAAAAAAS